MSMDTLFDAPGVKVFDGLPARSVPGCCRARENRNREDAGNGFL